MVIRTWRVYGADGHRQRYSFAKSNTFEWSTPTETRVVTVANADRTGTNDYSLITIARDTYEECEDELWRQISDGLLEDCIVGKIIEEDF